MAGIVGVLATHTLENGPQLLDVMLQATMHETFYRRASHTDSVHGWYAGSASIEGGFADCMPVRNETGDVLLFLAGECFLDARVTGSLRAKGHVFDRANAGALVHLYEQEGPGFVKKLNGWFSGVILDRRRRRALLFNDRFGMQRVYYHENASGLHFAFEAKALLRAIPSAKAVDPQSVAECLCVDCVPANRSYFQGVYLLPPGSLWIWEAGRIERTQYVDLTELEKQTPLEPEEFLEELAVVFKRVLPRYLAGGRICLALTGGLDTRLIVACLPRNGAQLVATTFAGVYRDSMDVRIARTLSKRCGIPHQTIWLDGEFLKNYPEHAARAVFVSDGQADATTVDSLYLEKRVRGIAPVKLTGAFGSQMLGRVRKALRRRLPNPELIHPDFRNCLSAVLEVADSSEHPLSYMLRREIPWYWSKFTSPQMSQVMFRSPFLDNDLVRLLYRAPRDGFDGSAFERRAIDKYDRGLMAVRTNKGLGGHAPPVVDGLIRNAIKFRGLTDRALNRDLLPHSMHHMVARADRWILTPLHLDRLFLGCECFRHYNLWFRRELAPYVREMLFDTRTLSRPYWNPKHLRRIVEDHIAGRRTYLSEIRKVLTIELIHRVLVGD